MAPTQLIKICSMLYKGQNSRGTRVYTWVAKQNQPSFDEEVTPLIQYLIRQALLTTNDFLGVVEFGTEAFYSTGNITFSASSFHMDLQSRLPGVSTPTDLPGPPFDPGSGAATAAAHSTYWAIITLLTALWPSLV